MTQKQTQQPDEQKNLHESMPKYCGHDPLAMRMRGGSSLQQLIYRVESLEEKLKSRDPQNESFSEEVNAIDAKVLVQLCDRMDRMEKRLKERYATSEMLAVLDDLREANEAAKENLKAAQFIDQARQPSAVNADPARMVIRKESMPDLYTRIEKLENVTHNLAELISKMGSTSAGVTNGQQALNVMLQKEITQLNEKVEDLQEEVANLQSQLLP